MVLTRTRTSPRDPGKFPATQLFLLALVRVAEPIALTSILPYAWKLVLHFHIGNKSNASFYAGVLIAAFALAESLTGMFWGGLSDRLGRKPVLIMGCFGTVASLLVVGFSVNFWMALFGRLLGGALNGNIGVIQTMVAELVVNPKHEPKAYAVMPFVWSVGTILGPCIGGYFATPMENFPDTFADNGIFGKFPFLLPNLICIGMMLISIVAGYLCLEETHPDMQPWSTAQDLEETQAATPIMATQAGTTTAAADLTHESYGTFNAISQDPFEEEWDIKADGTSRPSSLKDLSRPKVLTKRVIMLTVALGIFTYHSMTYDHLLPIFLQDDRNRVGDQHSIQSLKSVATDPAALAGGLGLSIKDVGFIMSINGIIALAVQAIIFPIMASWLGIWRVFILVTIGHPIAYFIVPWLSVLPENMIYPGIWTCLAIRNLFAILAYPVLLILIKEAAPSPNSLGKINGLAASTGAACRTIASPIAGLLYGIGINIHFTALAWWASALVALVGMVQAFFIRQENKRSQHQIRPAAPCRFMPNEQPRHRPSIVRIKVQGLDSGYVSEEDRAPLIESSRQSVRFFFEMELLIQKSLGGDFTTLRFGGAMALCKGRTNDGRGRRSRVIGAFC